MKGRKSKRNLLWALESDDLEWSVYAQEEGARQRKN